MILVDVNVPIHAANSSSRYHHRLGPLWEEQLSGPSLVAVPWAVCLGCVRVMTNPRIVVPPLSVDEALDDVSARVLGGTR